jgi:hypothetical protein
MLFLFKILQSVILEDYPAFRKGRFCHKTLYRHSLSRAQIPKFTVVFKIPEAFFLLAFIPFSATINLFLQ